jgi:hypothetical protein
MSHHACTGNCGGKSDTPAVCQAADCANFQKPMKECNCADDQHTEAKAAEDSASS